MILIKAVFLFLLVIFTSYRVGMLANKIFKSNNYANIILCGFISIVALLQIIYIPLILLHVAFNVVYYLSIILLIALIALSFVLVKIKSEFKLFRYNRQKLKTMKKKNVALTIILFIVVGIQALTSSILYNENADDAFYVSLVEQNQTSENIYTTDPATGIENETIISKYMVSGHELALSVISKMFDIPSTVLCHTILPFIMIIFSYMAYYVLARKLFNNEKAQILLLILSAIFLFSGFTTRFRGIILLSRMWQGKEIFLNIVLTLILANLISFNKYNSKKNLRSLTILNFAGVFFTNTAIFLIPFTYMGFAIIKLIKKEWKTVLAYIVTGIPVLIYGIIYLVVSKNIQETTFTQIDLIDVLKNYFGTGYYYILYILSLIIIGLKGDNRAKQYFLMVPLIYVLTIYNPLFINVITKYFTGSAVFWRLFWLLPVEISIAYSFVIILNLKNSKKYKIVSIIVEILLIILLGKFVYTAENGFEKPENLNKIPQVVIDQAYYIKENSNDKPTVMAPAEPMHSAMIRQMYSDINIFWSRDNYMKEIFLEEDIAEMQKIRTIYNNQVPEISVEEFDSIREKYNVNWIIVSIANEEILNYLDGTNKVNSKQIEGYMLYQY